MTHLLDYWSSNFLCDVGKFLPDCTASHLRKQESSKANMSAHTSGTEANKTSQSPSSDFGLYKIVNKNNYYWRIAGHWYFDLYVRWRQPCFRFRRSCGSSVCIIDGREIISVRVEYSLTAVRLWELNVQICVWVYYREEGCSGRSRCYVLSFLLHKFPVQ
jgi:hypothetical protein